MAGMRTLAPIFVAPLLLLGDSGSAGKLEDPAIEVCEYAMFQRSPAALREYVRSGEFITGNSAQIIYHRTPAGLGPMVLYCRFSTREGEFVLLPHEITWANCGVAGSDECRDTFPWSNRSLDDYAEKVAMPLRVLRIYPISAAATNLKEH
jgi:hypothetical protein